MGVRKVSNSKSDLQVLSRVLTTVPFDRPHVCVILDLAIFVLLPLVTDRQTDRQTDTR